jgi:histidinol phosphatase-like PHP family hydrolase
MPYLRGNLHVHTIFSDGAQTPQEMADHYLTLGYDFIAITDHDYLIKPNYWDSIPDRNGNLIVFQGIELEYPPLRYQHLGKILGEKEVLYIFNHPHQYRLTIPEVNRQIQLISRDMPIHCLEVTDKGVYTKIYDTPEIPLPKIASDDAHTLDQCGWAWVEVQSERDRDSILQAIKNGDLKIGLK